jgi:hypothetical protein
MSYQNTTAGLAALVLLLLPLDAAAANRHQTTDELTAEADFVVLGTVGVKNSRWGDDSRIYTDVLISTEVTLKGQDLGAVSVQVLGGTIGDVGMAVSDGAEFAQGERVLVFLNRHNDAFQVAGREAGKHSADSPNAAHVLERVLDRLEKDSRQKVHPRRGLAEAFLRKTTATASSASTTGTTTTTTSTACYLTDGTKWGTTSAKYKIGASVPIAWSTSINAAASTWNGAGAAFQLANDPYAANELSMVDLVTKYGTSYSNTYAVATVWFSTTTRIINKAAIEIGTKWQWTTSGQPNMADVQNILTHEFGHWMRLLDIYSPSACGEATMWGTSALGDTKQRTLEQADIDGVFSLYGKSPSIGAPVLISPANGALAISRTPTLAWNAALNATSYDVYFGTSSAPPLVATVSGASYAPGTLASGTMYYWRVVARNSSGTATSTTWSFMTAGALPAPVLVSPANGATGQSLTPTLKWNAVSGASSYELYFGPTSSPGLLGNLTTTMVTVSGLMTNTTYYWKIVAKGTSGASSSTVWSFRTN